VGKETFLWLCGDWNVISVIWCGDGAVMIPDFGGRVFGGGVKWSEKICTTKL
jgi:hypothetical protein